VAEPSPLEAAAAAELGAAGGTMVRAGRILLNNRKTRAAEGVRFSG
jgi:hypothetical protein